MMATLHQATPLEQQQRDPQPLASSLPLLQKLSINAHRKARWHTHVRNAPLTKLRVAAVVAGGVANSELPQLHAADDAVEVVHVSRVVG